MTPKRRTVATEYAAQPIAERIGKDNLVEMAFDLSSSCVGWAVGVDRELANYGKLVFKSTAGIGEKLVEFDGWLQSMFEVFDPERAVFEKPLSRKGNTTQRHNELMGIARRAWRLQQGDEIPDAWLLPATTIKRVMLIERGKNHSDNKRRAVDKVNQLFGLNLKYHRNSKLQTDDDTADAILVLETYWRLNKRGMVA